MVYQTGFAVSRHGGSIWWGRSSDIVAVKLSIIDGSYVLIRDLLLYSVLAFVRLAIGALLTISVALHTFTSYHSPTGVIFVWIFAAVFLVIYPLAPFFARVVYANRNADNPDVRTITVDNGTYRIAHFPSAIVITSGSQMDSHDQSPSTGVCETAKPPKLLAGGFMPKLLVTLEPADMVFVFAGCITLAVLQTTAPGIEAAATIVGLAALLLGGYIDRQHRDLTQATRQLAEQCFADSKQGS